MTTVTMAVVYTRICYLLLYVASFALLLLLLLLRLRFYTVRTRMILYFRGRRDHRAVFMEKVGGVPTRSRNRRQLLHVTLTFYHENGVWCKIKQTFYVLCIYSLPVSTNNKYEFVIDWRTRVYHYCWTQPVYVKKLKKHSKKTTSESTLVHQNYLRYPSTH